MYRGTTPTLTFTLPFNCSEITALDIAFAQGDGAQETVILEKTLADVELDGKKIICTLTENNTLLFDCTKKSVKIQLRVGIGSKRLASNIIIASVDHILKNGCLVNG